MNIKEFVSKFRNDWSKIIWPTRSDVFFGFILTIVIAIAFSVFFTLVDRGVNIMISYLLSV